MAGQADGEGERSSQEEKNNNNHQNPNNESWKSSQDSSTEQRLPWEGTGSSLGMVELQKIGDLGHRGTRVHFELALTAGCSGPGLPGPGMWIWGSKAGPKLESPEISEIHFCGDWKAKNQNFRINRRGCGFNEALGVKLLLSIPKSWKILRSWDPQGPSQLCHWKFSWNAGKSPLAPHFWDFPCPESQGVSGRIPSYPSQAHPGVIIPNFPLFRLMGSLGCYKSFT